VISTLSSLSSFLIIQFFRLLDFMTFCKTRFLFDKFHDMNVAEDGAADGGAELYFFELVRRESCVRWRSGTG